MPDSPDTRYDVALVPSNVDAEEYVVGSILIDGECINQITLSDNDFFYDQLRIIYRAMLDMKDAGISINQLTVAETLASRQRIHNNPGGTIQPPQKSALDYAGGAAYLSHLISVTPTSLDIEHYAEIVKRCSFYRSLMAYASLVGGFTQSQDPDTGLVLDKCETMLRDLRNTVGLTSRTLELGQPRLIQTNPPRYIWNVNGKDLRFNVSEITNWGKFRIRVVSELNLVPIKPKDWDTTVNNLLTASLKVEAPNDASDEQQMKIAISKWFDRMREASVYSELSVGKHVIRDFDGQSYYCFKSTPLIDYLKTDHKKGLSGPDLWVTVSKWGALKRSVRMKTADGSMPVTLWCVPIDFMEEKVKIDVPKDF